MIYLHYSKSHKAQSHEYIKTIDFFKYAEEYLLINGKF